MLQRSSGLSVGLKLSVADPGFEVWSFKLCKTQALLASLPAGVVIKGGRAAMVCLFSLRWLYFLQVMKQQRKRNGAKGLQRNWLVLGNLSWKHNEAQDAISIAHRKGNYFRRLQEQCSITWGRQLPGIRVHWLRLKKKDSLERQFWKIFIVYVWKAYVLP